MATVYGNLKNADGQSLVGFVTCYEVTAATYSGTNVLRPRRFKYPCDVNGKFMAELPAGVWQLEYEGVPLFQVTINPGDTGEFPVNTKVTATVVPSVGAYLPLIGGTMTGAIILAGDPTSALHPVSLQYLQAWTGSTTLTTLGTITTGVWNGTDIGLGYLEQIATNRVLGRSTAGTGDIEVLATLPSGVQDNITRLGTVTVGVWNGSIIGAAYLGSGTPDSTKYLRGDGAWATLDKSAVGLSNVENTALSTWTGSSNIATVGTITSGTWQGSDIAFDRIAQISTSSLLGRTTASTGDIEVLSASAVRTLLSINNVENTALSTWGGSSNISTVGTISSGTWNGSDIALAYIAQISTGTVLGRSSASTGDIEVLSTLPTAVQDNITRLGTIVAGTWNGSTIGIGYGGTGNTGTPTNGQVLIGNGSGYTRSTLTEGNGISISNGSGSITLTVVPGDLDVNDLQGTLGIGGGGTNATSFGTTNGIVTYNGTSLITTSGFTYSAGALNIGTTSFSQTAILAATEFTLASNGTLDLIASDEMVIQGDSVTIDSNTIAFFNGTPVSKQTHITDADGTVADITTKFNSLLAKLENYSLLATS